MASTTPSWLPLLIPIAVIELGLLVFALVDLIRRERVKLLPRWGWALIVLFLSFFGPLLYLLLGRED